jgi:hypothetical protein
MMHDVVVVDVSKKERQRQEEKKGTIIKGV